jgi:hypothetical protein
LAIALAGPAVNLVIAALIFAGLAMSGIGSAWIVAPAAFMTKLAWVNIALVVFNLLPAFPMDGGRVLRAALALKLPYTTATNAAAGVGQFVAIGFGLLGLFAGNLMLVFVAGFVFLAARGEAMRVSRDRRVATPIPAATTTQRLTEPVKPVRYSLPVVSVQWNAGSALGWLSDKSIDEFLVSSEGAVLGIIRKSDLRRAVLSGRGTWAIERLLAMRFVPIRGLQSV